MTRKYFLFFLIFGATVLASCGGDDDNYQTRMEDERNERSDYLRKNGITSDNLLSEGVYYQELYTPTDANAKKVEVGDDVVVYYTGYLLDGRVFDSNVLSGKFEPMTVRIQNILTGQIIKQGVAAGNAISGWPPALLQMKEGTKARVVIPSNRAYGIYGSNGIPGYSTLIFELEVEEVRKAE